VHPTPHHFLLRLFSPFCIFPASTIYGLLLPTARWKSWTAPPLEKDTDPPAPPFAEGTFIPFRRSQQVPPLIGLKSQAFPFYASLVQISFSSFPSSRLVPPVRPPQPSLPSCHPPLRTSLSPARVPSSLKEMYPIPKPPSFFLSPGFRSHQVPPGRPRS